MAVPAILPQTASPALRLLADVLAATSPDDLAFAHALKYVLQRIDSGIAYEPYNSTHYRIESHSQPQLWHYVTLDQCSCQSPSSWCWHRALLHLLTAHAALHDLHHCPRPTLIHIPPRDYIAVLRDYDECF